MTDFKRLEDGIYEQDSGIEGPILTIMGGVHGNETCGVEVLNFLMESIKIKVGKIFLVYGNMEGIIQGRRQIDQNLNRMFQDPRLYSDEEKQSYEYKRAQEIKPYFKQSDASLDLHSSTVEGSPVFVVAESNAADITDKFPFGKVCFGFDSIEPGGTDYYMNKIGKIGICAECGNHNAPDAMENAIISTREFLRSFGMLDEENLKKINMKLGNGVGGEVEKREYFIATRAYITQTDNFKVTKKFKDFESIKKGQLIGTDGEEKVYAENTGRILFAYDKYKIGVEGFVEIVERE